MKSGWVLVKRLRLLRLWSIAQIEENRPLGLRDHSTTRLERLERVKYRVLIQRWWNSFGFVWLDPIDPSSLTMSLTNLQVKIQMFDWGQILGCRFKELLGNFEVAVWGSVGVWDAISWNLKHSHFPLEKKGAGWLRICLRIQAVAR